MRVLTPGSAINSLTHGESHNAGPARPAQPGWAVRCSRLGSGQGRPSFDTRPAPQLLADSSLTPYTHAALQRYCSRKMSMPRHQQQQTRRLHSCEQHQGSCSTMQPPTLGFLGIKLEDLLLEDANTLKTAQITYHAEPSRPCYELPSPHTPQWTWCATNPREPRSRSAAC